MDKTLATLGLFLFTACATAQNPNLRPVKVAKTLVEVGLHTAKGVAEVDQELKVNDLKLKRAKTVIEEEYRKNPVTAKKIQEGPQPDYTDFITLPKRPDPLKAPGREELSDPAGTYVEDAPPAAVTTQGKPLWLQWLLAIIPIALSGLLIFGGRRRT